MMVVPKKIQKKKPLARTKPRPDAPPSPQVTATETIHYCEGLHERISRRAYEHYVERGYRDGCSLQDWLDAEREILSREQPV
jgi:hypothetical protein